MWMRSQNDASICALVMHGGFEQAEGRRSRPRLYLKERNPLVSFDTVVINDPGIEIFSEVVVDDQLRPLGISQLKERKGKDGPKCVLDIPCSQARLTVMFQLQEVPDPH